ncbi:right-handed parallel beta-helix repeat-containing protein, partial [[Eubacterium] cellulosolvens]
MSRAYNKIKNFITVIIIFLMLFQLIPYTIGFEPIAQANDNKPTDRKNGWWNTTEDEDWIINTTGNFWSNRNISVRGYLEVQSGGNLTLQNCTLIVNKNLIIEYNASLMLINVTLKFNSTQNGTAELLVKSGGVLHISDYDLDPSTAFDGSNITCNVTDGNHRFLFFINKGAKFSMMNSELHYCGYWFFTPDEYGLYVQADNSTIENNTFSDNYSGLVLESSNNIVRNNKIMNNVRYGCLIFMGRNNTLDNNTIYNNSFNFGLFLKALNQSNNFSLNNSINGKPLNYFEGANNVSFTIESASGFVAVVNSTNITIANQDLRNNFEGLFILGVNDSRIENSNFTGNNFGAILDFAGNITFSKCRFSNNTDIGINFIDSCDEIKIYNSTFSNNSMGLVVSDSKVVLLNSTINQSKISAVELDKGSYVKAINCTLDPKKVQITGGAKFEGQEYLHLRTMNHKSMMLGHISIDIYDGNNNYIKTIETNSTGIASWVPCTSYVVLSSGKPNSSMSNHRLYTEYSGMDFNQFINMNQSRTVNMYLNHQPIIINPPQESIYIDEEDLFYYDFNFTDLDGDNVTWHHTTDADWLNTIGLSSGILNGTPTDPDLGTFYVNVSCNDSFKGADFCNFTITVNNTNDPPMIISKQNSDIAYEDVFFLHDFNVFDSDPGDSHTWSFDTNAKWLYPINKLLGTIYGTPKQSHVGEYYINITVEDAELEYDYYNYTLRVYPTNDAPKIINRENKSVTISEEARYYYDFDYYDEDFDKVCWYLVTNASWLELINNMTGELEGTPHDNDVGIFFINISCMDLNNSIAFQNYSIVVKNTNDPPSLMESSSKIFYATEDKYFEQRFRGTDPDIGDVLKFDFVCTAVDSEASANTTATDSPHGSWLHIAVDSATKICKLYGTPTNDDVGELLIDLECSDLKGLCDNISFSIIVRNTNDAPWVTNLEENFIYTQEDFEYFHDFDFIDIDGDQVTWSMITDAQWLSKINNLTGELSGIPRQEDLGIYSVEVFCIDPFGGLGSQKFTIQVNNTNDPPIISNPTLSTVYIFEHQFYYYDFNASDIDSVKAFWASETNASWLNKIDRFTGIINGAPGDRDVGEFFVNITCMDDFSAEANWNFTIIVKNVNDPPQITNGYLAQHVVDVEKQYYFKFEYFDIDGDTVNWSVNTNAGIWLDFDTSTAVLSGTPTRLNIGIYYINITCEDPFGDIGYYKYDLRVRGTENRPPELSKGYVTPPSGDDNTVFTFYVTYRDLDYHEPLIVGVMIGDTPLFLEPYDGDDLFIGIVYYNSTKLSGGSYTYYFYAKDELNAMANVMDNTTPTILDPQVIEVSKTEDNGGPGLFGLKALEEPICLTIFIIFILIIIILIAVGIIVHRRTKRKQREIEPEELLRVEPSPTPGIDGGPALGEPDVTEPSEVVTDAKPEQVPEPELELAEEQELLPDQVDEVDTLLDFRLHLEDIFFEPDDGAPEELEEQETPVPEAEPELP